MEWLRGEGLKKIEGSGWSLGTFTMLADVGGKGMRIIVELRMGQVGLNVFLLKIKAVDRALWRRCKAPETVGQYLVHCKGYVAERAVLRRGVGKGISWL